MFEVTIKFETQEDKESFITSVINSFNSSGKNKSVWANTVERSGDTVFFTKKLAEEPVEEPAKATEEVSGEVDFSESSAVSSPATTETSESGSLEEVTSGADSSEQNPRRVKK